MRNVDQGFKELGEENLSRSGNKYFRKQSKAWSMHDRMKKNTVGSCLNKDIWSFFLLQSNCICMDSVLTSIDGGQGSRISIIIIAISCNCYIMTLLQYDNAICVTISSPGKYGHDPLVVQFSSGPGSTILPLGWSWWWWWLILWWWSWSWLWFFSRHWNFLLLTFKWWQ